MEYALESGARVVVMRSGPVRGPSFSRSPGDPVYDRMWARIAEAGILAAYHSGDAGYGRYADEWGGGGDFQAFRNDPFRNVTGGHRPIYDTIAALVCHGVFRRHPNLRVATIESGSDWVPLLLHSLEKSYGQAPLAYEGVDPAQQVRDHVWVSPYYEDNLPVLRDELGADKMIFGSDYPHAEGLADPLSFVNDLPGFSDDEIRLVMRENASRCRYRASESAVGGGLVGSGRGWDHRCRAGDARRAGARRSSAFRTTRCGSGSRRPRTRARPTPRSSASWPRSSAFAARPWRSRGGLRSRDKVVSIRGVDSPPAALGTKA